MANTVYNPGREGFLDGSIDWATGTIKVSLVRGYTFSAAHKFLTDVTGAGATLVSTQTLGTKTVTGGVASAANAAFGAVAAGSACQALVIYQSSLPAGGADVATSAQRVIAFIDTATGLPVTPDGTTTISANWDTGPNGIFKL